MTMFYAQTTPNPKKGISRLHTTSQTTPSQSIRNCHEAYTTTCECDDPGPALSGREAAFNEFCGVNDGNREK